MKRCNLMHAILKQPKWTNFTLDLQTRWNRIIFWQHWQQKSLTFHETTWRKHMLILIFWSTFTHGFFECEHLFVLISSLSTFLQSQQNVSTNSVSFVNPICGGGSNISKMQRGNINKRDTETLNYINKWNAETLHWWAIDECLSGMT